MTAWPPSPRPVSGPALTRWHQLLLALVFLTRLPLGRALPPRVLPLSDSLWAFPLVGALIGAVAALPLMLPGPPLLLAVLSVALAVWFTGALHEDALADFADAAGGRDRAEKLRIMRDSHIGSYGMMALLLSTGVRIAAIGVLGPWQLIAAAAGGRAAIVAAVALLPAARPDGLGRATGRATPAVLAVALGFAALALLPSGGGAAWAALAGALAAGLVMRQAMRWIGGQSGDVLGACGLACETAMLAAFALST